MQRGLALLLCFVGMLTFSFVAIVLPPIARAAPIHNDQCQAVWAKIRPDLVALNAVRHDTEYGPDFYMDDYRNIRRQLDAGNAKPFVDHLYGGLTPKSLQLTPLSRADYVALVRPKILQQLAFEARESVEAARIQHEPATHADEYFLNWGTCWMDRHYSVPVTP